MSPDGFGRGVLDGAFDAEIDGTDVVGLEDGCVG